MNANGLLPWRLGPLPSRRPLLLYHQAKPGQNLQILLGARALRQNPLQEDVLQRVTRRRSAWLWGAPLPSPGGGKGRVLLLTVMLGP